MKQRVLRQRKMINSGTVKFALTASTCTGFPGGAIGKNPPANAGDIRDTG